MRWITRFLKNSKGAVTVIVTLLLIPSILISGTAVDVARIYSAKSIVQDANSLGANAAMAQYNALLKDLYGLYGMKDEKLQSMVNDYIKLALFGDGNTPKGLGTFQPFYGDESSLSVTVSSQHNLGELEILQRQIEEYMALRAPVVIADDIMDIIDSMKKVSADANVIQDKLEIDDKLQDIHKIYKQIYQTIHDLDEYPDEEKIMVDNINAVMDRIHSQFRDLRGTRNAYISMQKAYREKKEQLEGQRDELNRKKSEAEIEKQGKEQAKQNKETERDSAQQDLNSAQQRLNNAQQRKSSAENTAEEQRKAAEARTEQEKNEAESKAQEEATKEEKAEEDKIDEEKKAEAAKAEEEQKTAQEKEQENQKAAQEAQQTQDQINQINNEINGINGEINNVNNKINGINGEIDQLNNEIAQKDAEIQKINDSLAEVEKKLEQETKNYEIKKKELKEKYAIILSNITALSTGGIVEKNYRSGKTDESGNYTAGYWEESEVIVPKLLGIGKLWGDNMSLMACRASGYDLVERFKKLVDKLEDQLKKAEQKKAEIKARLSSLKSKLGNCSSELQNGLTEKKAEYNNQSLLEYYEKILEYNLGNMANVVDGTEKATLDKVKEDLDEMGFGVKTGGKIIGIKLTIEVLAVLATRDELNDIENVENINETLDFVSFFADMTKDEYKFKVSKEFVLFKNLNEETGKFYSVLEELMKSTGTQLESKLIKSLSQILKAAKSLIQGTIDLPEGADYYSVSIGSAVTSDFGTEDNWEDTDQAKKSAKNSLSNPILAQLSTIANDCTNKLLLVTYGTSMFSNYATNKPTAADKKETSLTGVKFEKRANYFYQSEQEFLFAGKQEANKNLEAVSGLILLVRFITNYVAAFTLPDVSNLIRDIALELPVPANVIVSEIARFVLVLGQSTIDLVKLRMGYRVPLMHTTATKTWQLSPKGISTLESDAVNLFNSCQNGNSGKVDNGKGLTYANYLSVLLLFVDKTILTQRIQLLIELNLTNYKNDIRADSSKMASTERISLSKYAAGIGITTSVQMDTLFFTMKLFQDGIGGIKPSSTYTISDTIYRGY